LAKSKDAEASAELGWVILPAEVSVYCYLPEALPDSRLESVEPPGAYAGQKITVTIRGENFPEEPPVTLQGPVRIVAAEVQPVAEGIWEATFDLEGASAGLYEVGVSTRDGKQAVRWEGGTFAILQPAPRLDRVEPQRIPLRQAQPTRLILVGQHFTGRTEVLLSHQGKPPVCLEACYEGPQLLTAEKHFVLAEELGEYQVEVVNPPEAAYPFVRVKEGIKEAESVGERYVMHHAFQVVQPSLWVEMVDGGPIEATRQDGFQAGFKMKPCFDPQATVWLHQGDFRIKAKGKPEPRGDTDVVTVRFDLAAAPAGAYEVVVENGDGVLGGALRDSFIVREESGFFEWVQRRQRERRVGQTSTAAEAGFALFPTEGGAGQLCSISITGQYLSQVTRGWLVQEQTVVRGTLRYDDHAQQLRVDFWLPEEAAGEYEVVLWDAEGSAQTVGRFTVKPDSSGEKGSMRQGSVGFEERG
jgi:hypothetical protein